MVDLEEHFLPAGITLIEDGETWGQGSTFLVILVPSNCFSSATISVSYGIVQGGLVFP